MKETSNDKISIFVWRHVWDFTSTPESNFACLTAAASRYLSFSFRYLRSFSAALFFLCKIRPKNCFVKAILNTEGVWMTRSRCCSVKETSDDKIDGWMQVSFHFTYYSRLIGKMKLVTVLIPSPRYAGLFPFFNRTPSIKLRIFPVVHDYFI